MGSEGAARDTRSRFASRWGLNFAILAIGGLVGLQLYGMEATIDSYRVDGQGGLVVTVSSGGAWRWNRVAEVDESNIDVKVTIRTAHAPVPLADIGIPTELVVTLDEPLGDRVVIDAKWGEPVRRSP
jgi:hypothetical protein